jgi:hypothetical protein
LKNFDLGQAIAILANVGVIAGIVFLAVEIRQNNELMAAQARQVSFENNRQFAEYLFENRDLAEVLAKVEAGEDTTPAEDIQLYGFGIYTLRSFEFAYQELGELDIPATKRIFYENRVDYRLADTWEIVKSNLNPEFVIFIDENIIDHR